MKKACKKYRSPLGFSLAEVLASVMIGAMVLVAMVAIHSRAETGAAAIERRLGNSRLPSEVLQRIAEDLDSIIASGPDTKVTVENKFVEGYPAARLTIQKTINDSRNRAEMFERIVWQSSYDYESDANGLVLYRSHSGMTLEDKLLDEQRTDVERYYPLVPICKGVTFFSVQVPRGEGFLDKWPGPSLPGGIVVTISFAEPFETLTGTLDVLEEEKITRTIAIDRTRKIKFVFVKPEEEEDVTDANDTRDANDVKDANDVVDAEGKGGELKKE